MDTPTKPRPEQCPYCHNHDVRPLFKHERIPYDKHHGFLQSYKAFFCFCCNATWHYKTIMNVALKP